MPAPRIRPRRAEDVAAVVELLVRQQPLTHYPLRNPLPFPVEEFVVRRNELASWVAEIDGPDGPRIAGHVSASAAEDDEISRKWAEAVQRPVAELGAVSVFVVDHELTGRGIGRALMDTCEAHLLRIGRAPVLEVLNVNARAGQVYRARGWEAIGTAYPQWLPEGAGVVELMVLRRS